MLGSTAELAAELLDQLEDPVWVLDAADGTVVDLNPSAGARLGRRRDAVIGRRFGDLLTPPMPPEGWRLLLDHLSGGRRHRVPAQLIHEQGATVLLELDLRRHVNLRHDVVLAVGHAVDAGEVATPARLLASAIHALDEGVAVVDPTGRIAAVNHVFCDVVGLPAAQLLDRSVYDPPWTAHDESGMPVEATDSPAVRTLRTGGPERGPVHSVDRGAGDRAWFHMSAHPLPHPAGAPDRSDGILVVLSDLTESRRAEEVVQRLLATDPLTGLWSRARIATLVEESVRATAAAEGDGRRVGVLHVDLDNFRTVNDTFGSVVGDQVLAQAAERLRDLADRRLEIGRMGVDEFLVVVAGDDAALAFDARLRRVAEEVQRRLGAPYSVGDLDLRLTASVGVARTPGDAAGAADLLTAADRALSTGRAESRHRLRFYDATLDERTRTGLVLDRDLRLAAAQRSLDVHYQPIIDLRTGEIAAAEALVRWHHPTRGPVPPSLFIPTAEATGSIVAISDVVLSTVAEDIARWSAEGLLPDDARIAVNISATEFEQRQFTERLARTLDDAGITADRLELEITESLLVQDLRAAAGRLEELDDLGFLIALDDFGTGYSSLSYLHSLPLHTLKIDRKFVGDLRDGRSGSITRAILTLAHNLGIVAVAEGVETDDQRDFLTEAGCDLVQGFLFAPPLPRPAFERFLAEPRGVLSLVG
ncbi:MAG: putative bifunctional diguanylate cyclase/phosphodiesterase [Microthrixaceae bacterium]